MTVIVLVFERPDGTFDEEPWSYDVADGDAVRLALRDGQAGAFGRRFAGLARIHRPDGGPELGERGVGGPLEAAEEPARHPIELAGLGSVRWGELACAFGPGTWVGVHLRRCLAVDPAVGVEAAHAVGEGIAHQGSLYPVTAAALPFVAALLGQPSVSGRAELAEWLAVVAESAADRGGPLSKLVGRGLIRWSWRRAPELADELVRAQERQATAARASAEALRGLTPELRGLRGDPVVGRAIEAVLARC